MIAAQLRRLLDAFANNKESRTPANSSIASCPLAECEVSSLTVTCAHHSERKMRLDLLSGKPTRNNKDYVLQVVSDPDKVDEITVIFSGRCGCGNPAEICPTVSVQGGLPRLKQPAARSSFPPTRPSKKAWAF